jgi:hypothetical protein
MENSINIKELVQGALYNINEGYIISLWNDEMGCDAIFTRDDFDDRFRGESFLDIIDRLDGSFDASDDYFKDSCLIESASSLEDLIDYDHMEDFLVDCIENAIDRDSMPEGFEELFDEYESLKKHPHTEEEIKAMLKDTILDLPPSMLVDLLKLDGMDIVYMHDFTERAKLHSIPTVIGKLAFSIGWFEFGDIAYEETDERYISYSSPALAEEVCKRFDGITDEQLKDTGFDALVQIRHGEW